MRDRYLFSADRKASEYRSLLEITRGHARLLTPSTTARQLRWVISAALGISYYAVTSSLFVPLLSLLGLPGTPPAVAWAGILLLFGAWALGALALFYWWDRRSLPLLADAPSQAIELVLLGARSFGTYQDVRTRTAWGEEFHLVVDSRGPRFWEAVALFQGKAAVPAGSA